LTRALAPTVLLACSLGSAGAETRAGYGGTVHVPLASTLLGLDPLSPLPGEGELAALVYDTPFRLDNGRPRPHLASALDNPDGALRARLRLRPDVRFHDGTPLRASDLAASLARALGAPGGWTLGPIRAVRAVADDLLELDLSRPAPDLPLLLTTPAAAVLPGGAPRARPLGSGPFAVDKWERQAAQLRAFNGYFAGRPFVDRLLARAFATRAEEAGSYEVGALEASRHGKSAFDGGAPKHATLVADGPATITVFLALGRALPDELARPLGTALSLGIDRERLRRLTAGPSVATAAAAPAILGGPAVRPPFDPARARAGLETALAGRRPRVGLLVDGSRADERAIADRLLAELVRLGIDVTLEPADPAVYRARLESRRYQLALGSSLPPAPDGGLAELALLAAVDAPAARALLARSPATVGMVALEAARVVPLVHRAPRLHHVAELRGLTLDFAGRASWADVHFGPRPWPR
jgi:peptide/nickel transport system substrate-binding protein